MEFLQSKKIILKQSPIHGLGVFALDKIFAGEVFEECPVLTLPIPKGQGSPLLIDYRFNWPQGTNEWEEQVIALGYGSFYNHSENANAHWTSNYNERTFKFISNRKINKGEEIFVWYGDVSYWSDGRQNISVF
jgi:SET domain-containing protein